MRSTTTIAPTTPPAMALVLLWFVDGTALPVGRTAAEDVAGGGVDEAVGAIDDTIIVGTLVKVRKDLDTK